MSKSIKLYFVENISEGNTDLQIRAMKEYFSFTTLEQADAIFCASVERVEQAFTAWVQTKKPFAIYCWDYYLFAHDGRHTGWNWKKYAEILSYAHIIFVPSLAQQLQLKELLGLDSMIVKSGIETYEHKITDAGFILDPLRYYPVEQAQWPERAAKELGIPLIHSEHQYKDRVEFRKLVASCSFMTCAVPEASTGGLTLSEGLWLGKVSLISDSPFQGAEDYVGKYSVHFKHNDYEDFKRKMKEMWDEHPFYDGVDSMRLYMTKELTFDKMAKGIYEGIKKITHSD